MSYLPLHALRKKVADESVELWIIPTADAGETFDKVSPLAQLALDRAYGRLDASDVRERLADGRMQLMVFTEKPDGRCLGVLVTEFVTHPQGQALSIALVGGREMHRWLDRLLEIERWAKSEGCRWVEVSGRFGWERVLRGLDYQRIHVTLAKEL